MAGWSHHWAGFGDLFDDLGSRELWEVLRHVDPIYQPARFNHTVLMLRAGNDEASGESVSLFYALRIFQFPTRLTTSTRK